MSNLNAAIGIAQLNNCDIKFNKRKKIVHKYFEDLKDFSKVDLLNIFSNETVYHIFPILVDPLIRDDLRSLMLKDNIETGIHYKPNHLLEFYKSEYSLPISENIGARIISLPLHTCLTTEEQDFVISRLIYNINRLS